jgi:Flp pilus assembly pilin Flp
MSGLLRFFGRLISERDGQDMVEYGLILGLVSVIAVAAVTTTGTSVNNLWSSIAGTVSALP